MTLHCTRQHVNCPHTLKTIYAALHDNRTPHVVVVFESSWWTLHNATTDVGNGSLVWR
jgi:hypothetical protein